MIGLLSAVWLISQRRLCGPLIAAAGTGALVLGVLSARPHVLASFLLLGALGMARSVLDVSGRTLLLRAAPQAVRGRLFGVLEGVATLALAVGAMLAPLLLIAAGLVAAWITGGILLALVASVAAPALRRLDQPGLAGCQARRIAREPATGQCHDRGAFAA